MAGLQRRLPEPVMGGEIAIGGPELGKPGGDELEMGGLLIGDLDPISKNPRGKSGDAKRAIRSQARSMALSSIWARAWRRAIRPASPGPALRLGISLGASSSGLAGRAGRSGGWAVPGSISPRRQRRASPWASCALAAGSAVARISTAPAARVGLSSWVQLPVPI